MPFRMSLKRKLKRAVQKLYKRKQKQEEHSTVEPALEFQTHKVDQPCPLLGLPIELSLQILDLLLASTPVKSSCHQPYLISLRLTCKEMYYLVTPLLYRVVDLNTIPGVSPNDCTFMGGSLTRIQKFARGVKTVGPYIQVASVRVLKPKLWSRARDVDLAIFNIFSGAPHLHTLTINYDIHDFNPAFHSSLLDAIPHLNALKHITMQVAECPKGAPIPESQSDYDSHIAGCILASLINHHGQNLLSINIYGGLKIGQALFTQIRDKTPNLQTFGVLMALTIELSPLLREPKPWACAGTLQSLTIVHCTIHAEDLTTQLALGAFGALRHLSLFCCGHPKDDQSLRTKVRWRGPPLDTFRLHHFIAWEVETLSAISARLIVATKVEPEHFSTAIRNPNSFPGVERIRISSGWGVDELVDLQKAAASREIKVATDWDRNEDPLAEEFQLISPCPCLDCLLGKLRL